MEQRRHCLHAIIARLNVVFHCSWQSDSTKVTAADRQLTAAAGWQRKIRNNPNPRSEIWKIVRIRECKFRFRILNSWNVVHNLFPGIILSFFYIENHGECRSYFLRSWILNYNPSTSLKSVDFFETLSVDEDWRNCANIKGYRGFERRQLIARKTGMNFTRRKSPSTLNFYNYCDGTQKEKHVAANET